MGTIKTFALLIGLTLISVQSAEWYKEGPIYQIYPAAFADSDGDGTGDLRGISAHADYLKDIGIGAVWLSPVFESPMKDNGYDVKNYTVVSSLFGSMEDMENLIATFHERGIKVLLDFVPNHTSDESTWFKDSVKKINGKENWYVWKDPKGKDAKGNPVPPNNWRSKFGVGLSAWTYVPERGQYYFHQFGDYQPDLNYEHSEVLTAVKESLRFWLGKGIDGFRMDAVPFIGETSYGSDEPLICTPDNGTYECLDHIYTMNQEVTYKVLNAFDEVLREPQFTKQGARVMFVESYNPLKEQLTYYGNVSYPFNFQYILNIRNDSDAYAFQNCTMEFLNNLGGRWPNWVVGNHDNSRVGSRMGPAMIDTMNILTLLLPGVAITYNGEELGMTDGLIRSSQRRDFGLDRDPERTPMQWNATRNAGFTQSNKPYLPANPNYYSVNVEAEKNVSTSHLNIYKKAVKLHKQYIDTTLEQMNFTAVSKWVFGFHRPGLVVITNLNNKEENVTVKDFKFATPDSIAVALSTPYTNLTEGAKVSVTDKLILHPRGTIVLQYGQKSSGAERTAFSIFIMFACLYFTLGKN